MSFSEKSSPDVFQTIHSFCTHLLSAYVPGTNYAMTMIVPTLCCFFIVKSVNLPPKSLGKVCCRFPGPTLDVLNQNLGGQWILYFEEALKYCCCFRSS